MDDRGQPPVGRARQRDRTRRALLAAAAALMREGAAPSVAEVADAAEVSRATAYRYFPSRAALLVTAGLQEDADRSVDGELAGLRAEADPARRAGDLAGLVGRFVGRNETAFRAMLHAVLDPAAGPTPRQANRVRWIEEALGTDAERLDPVARRRLVAALSMVCGIEATIVLRDVCGLDPAEAAEVARWSAGALVRQALAEAGGD